MKYINIDNWSRKEQYHFFKQMDYPHINLCAQLDMTRFYSFTKENKLSFFKTILHIIARVANEIPEFRYRIRDEQVVEHPVIHPAFTVMGQNNIFSFCHTNYSTNFHTFYQEATQQMAEAQQQGSLAEDPNRDDWLYITSIPWVSFTSMTHPIHLNPVDSVPRIAIGKFYEENGKWKLPLSVQVHHALMDGFHLGKYFELFQEYLNQPEKIFTQ